MAAVMCVVAPAAQRCHLPSCPPLVRDAVLGEAVVAEPPCDLAAIDTWATQLVDVANSEYMHRVR